MAGKANLKLVLQAAKKLDAQPKEWANVFAFIQSCYCCVVRNFDLADALYSLGKLTEEEAHALIAWVMLLDEVNYAGRQA
jgi:hypothetical protein